MTTLDNVKTQESVKLTDEEQQQAEKVDKLFKIGKISILAALTILWGVSAVLGLISLWKGEGILDTPWVILGLVLLIFIIVFVVTPLFRSLRADVKAFNKEKAEKEKLEQEFKEVEETKESE